MKSELEKMLELNPLHKHLTYAIETIEEAFDKNSLKKIKPNEKIKFIKDDMKLELSYNNHSVFVDLIAKEGLVLYYGFCPLDDTYREISCNVDIQGKLYDVDIKETIIHKKFISSLKKISHQMINEIKKEHDKHTKLETMKENKTIDLIRRSNLCKLFEEEPIK